MSKQASTSSFSQSSVSPPPTRFTPLELRHFHDEYTLECQLKQFTPQTLYCRGDVFTKFFWFLDKRGFDGVSASEIKQFIGYMATGHTEAGGRWGNPRLVKAMKPVTMVGYYRTLHAFFNWMVEEEIVTVSLMARVKAPIYRPEVKQPVSREVITLLLEAAKRSQSPERNEAILLVLLDTGVRASELCGIKMKDVDLAQRTLRILGKGQKYRTCYLGRATTKALMKHLRTRAASASATSSATPACVAAPDDALFVGAANAYGGPLTKSGLFQLLKRLAKAAGVPTCGPHALRRTFAVEFLRASNGNVFTVQHLLGHTDLTQTKLYCAISEADTENQHRQFSPADRLKRAAKEKTPY
ncbi:Site-specific recombinase XerD [Abditibacterium utsteinense]|uniref:Site-specific recombinase XerD n=1 Tax=Abditibacterium utsteinense TaxID=1960156 RepID=A0A2S8SWZ1_9BACT|nr:tyrosine-type recombinase/integrase [Abditibacterium utsteinense]PQV65279.1 Site-specific recombinase XerD [Abditibacterium utsteinense]